MMSGQNGSRQVIEAILACLAQVSLSVPLAIVMAVADYASVTAVKADNAVRPSQLTNDFIALRFVEQVRQFDLRWTPDMRQVAMRESCSYKRLRNRSSQ